MATGGRSTPSKSPGVDPWRVTMVTTVNNTAERFTELKQRLIFKSQQGSIEASQMQTL